MARRTAAFATVVALGLVAPASLAQSPTEVVTRADDTFSPKRIVVATGATVTFRNGDSGFHNVTWDDGAVPPTPTNPSSEWPVAPTRTFTTTGTFRYFCAEHGFKGGGGMSGSVIVTVDGKAPPPTPALTGVKATVRSGVATLKGRANVAGTVSVVLQRRTGRRFVAGGSITKRLTKAGAFTVSLRRVGGAKPGPGSYRAQARLKDSTGHRSAVRTASFAIAG
jgi:plastocyanin